MQEMYASQHKLSYDFKKSSKTSQATLKFSKRFQSSNTTVVAGIQQKEKTVRASVQADSFWYSRSYQRCVLYMDFHVFFHQRPERFTLISIPCSKWVRCFSAEAFKWFQKSFQKPFTRRWNNFRKVFKKLSSDISMVWAGFQKRNENCLRQRARGQFAMFAIISARNCVFLRNSIFLFNGLLNVLQWFS